MKKEFDDRIEYRDEAGQLHREDGPAIEFYHGSQRWYQHGNFHRTDGPAVIYSNGNKIWYQHGKIHRLDGPAIEWDDGDQEWWINDVQLTEEEVKLYTFSNKL